MTTNRAGYRFVSENGADVRSLYFPVTYGNRSRIRRMNLRRTPATAHGVAASGPAVTTTRCPRPVYVQCRDPIAVKQTLEVAALVGDRARFCDNSSPGPPVPKSRTVENSDSLWRSLTTSVPGPGRVKTPRRFACKDQLEFVTLQAMYGRRDCELTVIRILALMEISSIGETISAARF